MALIVLATAAALLAACNAQSTQYPKQAVALLLMPGQQFAPAGNITFTQQTAGGAIQVTGTLRVPPNGNNQRGFHIHELGIIYPDCTASGSHYNPFKQVHGSLNSSIRHIGDLGNVPVDQLGNINVNINIPYESLVPLSGAYSVIGRTLVVHEQVDDLGLGGSPVSNTTGNAGGRVACGVIGVGSPNFFVGASVGTRGTALLVFSSILLALSFSG